MRRMTFLAVLIVLAAVWLMPGCGNVQLQGEALTGAKTSVGDAYQAVQRAEADPAVPAWLKAYQVENFKQWRYFVRAAVKDEAWGPKLEGE